jgi:eukaryotic-like serine/threonine-protein kinase
MTTKHLSSVNGEELLPGSDVGGYYISHKIGEGGMGVVYGAQHPSIGKRVAIKVLGPAFCRDTAMVARFEQEARLVNEIHHHNIVDIFQLGVLPDGRKYLVMEWLEGESLSGRIARSPIPAPEAVEILDAIADALIATHEKGIIHRDMKSDNVFLANTRGQVRVKLLDFGLAKLSGNDPRAVTKTKTGMVVGTPHYMAPEQIRGKQADQRTDVYSLGILAYKMLVGKLPWDGLPTELLIHHLKTPPPLVGDSVPGTPPALSAMVVRMMAKAPEERPTLPELRAFFADLRSGRATHAPAPAGSAAAPVTHASAPAQRPAWIYVVMVLAVLASAGIAFAIVAAAKS